MEFSISNYVGPFNQIAIKHVTFQVACGLGSLSRVQQFSTLYCFLTLMLKGYAGKLLNDIFGSS